ncbi:helix-turn-helix domain-containing protein [Clostridium subterminale]|uniref:Helix-turn-helix domain-containing protein n=1 Tax=Clostridium subterminale TaxID=1550 RepID=A0ABN1KPV8_CLOSU
MNRLNVGETILRLRKEKKITQEQLASMIGISAGAVSKWETGNSTPDISLLAPLARALDTSLDILLSFQQELSELEVINIKKELVEMFLHQGYMAGELRCKEYEKEYPNSVYLKLIIAELVQMYSMMSGNVSEECIKSRMEYCLALLYQVTESKVSKYISAALFSIANIQMTLENYGESEKAIKELLNSFIDPMVLYSSLLQRQGKNREAENMCKGMLIQYLTQSNAMISILASISKREHNYEKATLYLDVLNQVENIFKIGMGSGAYNYCRLYIEIGDKELASKWFNNYVKEILSTEYDYSNNPYFENLKLEVNVEGQKIIRKKLFQSLIDEEDLKVLSGSLEYEDAIKALKNAVSEM